MPDLGNLSLSASLTRTRCANLKPAFILLIFCLQSSAMNRLNICPVTLFGTSGFHVRSPLTMRSVATMGLGFHGPEEMRWTDLKGIAVGRLWKIMRSENGNEALEDVFETEPNVFVQRRTKIIDPLKFILSE
ncbi:hypothetical protein SDJN03_16363, partial [Cucurbita argyrosperma subsp. sororia]